MQPPALSLARRIDELADRFEAACQSGMTARLEEYVDRVPAPDRAAALAALLSVELEVRRKSGAAPRAAEYQTRFPELADVVEAAFAQAAMLDTSVLGCAGTLPLERPLVAAAQPPLARIGRFVVIGQLGAGAFGEVYRCHDPELDRDVAIKVPRKGTLETAADVERFLREGRAAATMQHPNICPVHEVGTSDGRPYIVMALVPGKSLAEHIQQRAEPLPEHQAATIVRKLATALDFAHFRGIIHRDLKPANIMVLADGDRKDVVVMDFGLARSQRPGAAHSTQTGMLMGTPAYMSPEQARGDQRAISPRSDIYSLGVIMYELLTRHRPFNGSVAEVLGKVLHVQPEPPSLHRPGLNSRLESICLQAMAKEPERRFASMRELADALAPAAWKPAAAATSTAPAAAISTIPAAAAEPKSLVWTDELKTLGPVPAVRQRVARQRTQQVGQLVAAAVLGVALLCGIVIYVATNEGTVKITLSDPSAQVEVKVDGKTIEISGLDDPLTFRAGPHGLVVTGKNYETFSKSFTVKRGENPVVRVELVAKATPLPPPSKQLVEKLVPSLVFVKTSDDSRMPIGVVTDLGVCTVMPGTFSEVELTTLDGKRKFAGTVVSRNPYPFCWIESKDLDLSPLPRTDTGESPTPQETAFFMVSGKSSQAHAGRVSAGGAFTTAIEFGPRPGEVVASAPVFSQDGKCLGFVARQDRQKPLDLFELRRFAWQQTAATPAAPPALAVPAETPPPMVQPSEPAGEVRRFPAGYCMAAAGTPDGLAILSSDLSGDLKLWDINTGAEVRPFDSHKARVDALAISPPDGRYALTGGGDHFVRLWDMKTGKQVREFSGHTGPVDGVAFSPDGRQAISGGWDGTIRVWDVSTAAEVLQCDGHNPVAYSPLDNRYVIFACKNSLATFCLYDLVGRKEVRRFKGHEGNVTSVAFSLDAQRVLSMSVDTTVRLWETETAREVHRFDGHTKGGGSVAFSPKGRHALSLAEDGMRLWDLESKLQISHFFGHSHPALARAVFLPDGQHAVSCGGDGMILWKMPEIVRLAPADRAAPAPVPLARPEVTNSIGMQLARIPAGKFLMGSPADEVNRGDDEEQHEVAITRAFYMGVHEVTQAQYEKVIGKNPAAFKEGDGGGANHPVDSVSWQDAVDFCTRLSELPAEKAAGRVYRLPTEAEWEYACRGGTTTPYNDGDPARRRMLVTRSFLGETAPVGAQKPNRFGLFDMHGNIQEWCADWYAAYPTGRQVDPTGPATGTGRVIRGGWHEDGRNEVGSAERAELAPVFPIDDMGFRVVCNAKAAAEGGILAPSLQSADPDRGVAEWVYSVGGKVSLDGSDQECQDFKDLPAGRLRVTGLTLGFTQVTDTDLARLAPLGELTRLHLHGCNIGDEGMAHLKTHKRLAWLSLWDTNVGDAGMQNLAGLADLDYLTLNGTRVTDAGLAQLSGLAKLKVLHLAALSGVTGDGLRHIKGLQDLEYLDLHDTSTDDRGLAHLSGLMILRTLILSDTNTGDSGLAAIKPLKNLRHLNLTGTRITDAGLRHCEGQVNLRELNLDHTSASPAAVQTLQKALPTCKITAVKP